MPSQYVMHQVRAHADPGTESVTKKVYNVYVFQRPVGAGTPSKSQNQTAFKASILTPLQACLSTSYVTDFLDTRFLDDFTDPYLTTALGMDGTVAGESMPSVLNVLVHLGSGVRGLSNKGSKKYGPIAEADSNFDQLIAGAITRWNTFSAALLAGYTDAGGFVWKPFIVSQKNSRFGPRIATVNGVLVSTVTPRATLVTLKRRKQPVS